MSELVFDSWRGKPLGETLAACRDLVEDTTFPTVKKWRQGGGKVAGHFQVYFPEEIAHAAGFKSPVCRKFLPRDGMPRKTSSPTLTFK